MQVHGAKVNTVSSETSKIKSDEAEVNAAVEAAVNESQENVIIDYFEQAFNQYSGNSSSAGSSNNVGNTNPLDDYTFGEIQEGTLAKDPTAESPLENFPPTVDDIMTNDERAVNYLDVLKGKYEASIKSLEEILAGYSQAKEVSNPSIGSGLGLLSEELYGADELAAGELSLSDKLDLNDRITAVKAAIDRCNAQISRIAEVDKQMESTYQSELSSLKDLNGDTWIGRPRMVTSYRYLNGKVVDAATLLPVTSAVMKNMQAQLAASGLDIAESPLGAIEGKDGQYWNGNRYDTFFALNETAINNRDTNYANTALDFGIPETINVQRGLSADDAYKIETTEDGSEDHYVLAGKFIQNSDGSIVQEETDPSTSVPIRVTRAVVSSDNSGLTTSPIQADLKFHTIELYNGDTLIARMRIEGFEPSGISPNNVPSYAPEVSGAGFTGNYYCAPSCVAIAFNGNRRASPLEFDASQYETNTRLALSDDNLKTFFGDDALDTTNEAQLENIAAFKKPDADGKVNTRYWNETANGSDKWTDDPITLKTQYGTDEFNGLISDGVGLDGNKVLSTYKTGVIIHEMRGVITGSKQNDIIETFGVNQYSEDVKNNLMDDYESPKPGDPSYKNIVRAGGGHNVVICGKGDNIIENATFVKIEDAGTNDNNIVGLQQADSATKANAKCYVWVDGGNTQVVGQANEQLSLDDTTEESVKANDGARSTDDFFHITGSWKYSGEIYPDEMSDGQGMGGSALNTDGLSDVIDTATDALTEELNKEPVKEADVDAALTDYNTAAGALTAEMDGFFNSMFSELDSLFADYEESDEV